MVSIHILMLQGNSLQLTIFTSALSAMHRILNELEIKFDNILKTCQLFSALEPKNFLKKGNDEQLKHLCNAYEKDIDSTSVQFEYPAL